MAEPDYRNCAAVGIAALQRWYEPASGLLRGTGWWNCANALTALIRYTKLTGDDRQAGVIATTVTSRHVIPNRAPAADLRATHHEPPLDKVVSHH